MTSAFAGSKLRAMSLVASPHRGPRPYRAHITRAARARGIRLALLAAAAATALLAGCADSDCHGDACGEPDAVAGPDATATAPADPDAAPPEITARVIRTEGVGLNLRASPSTDAEVLALMPAGELVDALGEADGDWIPVSYEGMAGYGHTDFLEILDGEEMLFLLPWTAGDSFRVTQGNNSATGSHSGMSAWAWDFGMPIGTPVLSSHAGTVRRAKGDSTVGGCDPAYANDSNYVVVDRGNGVESGYLHLDTVVVEVGDVVSRGQLLGTSGETGYACGPHLHFQIQRSPDGGGTESWWNQSVDEFFYDTGEPYAPPYNAELVSQNGALDLP